MAYTDVAMAGVSGKGNAATEAVARKCAGMSLKDIKKLGNGALYRNQPDSAMMYYNIIFGHYNDGLSSEDMKVVVGSYINSGYINTFYKNELAKAFADYQKAEDIATETGVTSLLPFIYLNKGTVYATYNDSVKTMSLYKQAFYTSIPEKQWDITLTSFTNIMQLLNCVNQSGETTKLLTAFDKLHIPKDVEMLGFTKAIAKAGHYVVKHQWDDAIRTIESAENKIDIELQPERYQMACEQMIGQIYMRKHDYARAVPYFLKVLNVGRQDNAVDCISDGLNGLTECYAALGMQADAYKYRLMKASLRDSLFNSRGYVQIRDMEAELALNKVGAQVDKLEKDKRRQFVFLTVLSVLVVLILIILFGYIRKNHIQKQLLRSLYEKNEEVISMERKPTMSVPDNLLDKVEEVMSDVSIISQTDFTILTLAELIGSKDRYVSQAINEGIGKNFNSWLGELRVHEACRRLSNPAEYGGLTIEAIGQSLGFKSRSNFTSVFKKVTGLTPSEYIKMAGEKA